MSVRDVLVLRARPQPEEAAQAFSALRDLLAPVDVSRELTPPLRRSLEVALLVRDADAATDPSLVGPATAAVLEIAARASHVLLAIDDIEWLDADTLRALRFAINRLPARVSLAVVFGGQVDPISLLSMDRVVPPDRRIAFETLPLTIAGIHHLLSQSFGEVPRQLVHRVAAASAGNPRAALELARSWRERPEAEWRIVPTPVAALVERRLGGLSPDADRLTQLIAVAGRLSIADLAALAGDAAHALDEAERAGAVIEEDGIARPADGLVATVALGRATPATIRDAHARLARIAGTPDERARHLAALPEAAAHVAEIEAGADSALSRGAVAAAATLYDRAVQLTPADQHSERSRRLWRHARALLAAGDPTAARESAEAAIAAAPPQERPRVIAGLSDLAWADGTMQAEERRVRGAVRDARDPKVRLDLTLALVAFGAIDEPGRAVEDATAALRDLAPDTDAHLRGYLLIHREMASALAGHGVSWDRLRQGVRLEEASLGDGRAPSSPALVLFTMCDQVAEARARHAIEVSWYAERGEAGWGADRDAQLALVELRAGNTVDAQRLADDACDRLDRLQIGGGWPLVYAWRSLVDAHLGRLDRARETLARLQATVADGTIWAAIVHSVEIAVAYAAGDHLEALEHARRMHSITQALGVEDLLADRSEPILAEISLATGDAESATAALRRLEQRHAVLPRAWTAAALVRTRAIVLAAQGARDAALVALDDPAVDLATLPFEAAWTNLTRGRLLRRQRDRLRAAAALTDAASAFERLGAVAWAAHANAELARVGLRRRRAGELTDGELTIARLAGKGMTSREIAHAAFVSPKTVEANLTRIYRKLDIRSRAELGAWLQEREGRERQT